MSPASYHSVWEKVPRKCLIIDYVNGHQPCTWYVNPVYGILASQVLLQPILEHCHWHPNSVHNRQDWSRCLKIKVIVFNLPFVPLASIIASTISHLLKPTWCKYSLLGTYPTLLKFTPKKDLDKPFTLRHQQAIVAQNITSSWSHLRFISTQIFKLKK